MFSSSLLALALTATPEVTLDQAIALAMAGNAQLKVARAEVELARAQVPLAHDWDLPKLRLMVNNVDDVPTGQFRWYGALSWLPPNPWVWKNGADAAENKLMQSQLEFAALSWRLVRELRLAWVEVSGAAAHEALAKETVEVRRKMVALLARRLAQGQGTQIDLNLAKLGEADARQDELRWQGAGLRAAQSVAYLVGHPVVPKAEPVPDGALPVPSLELLLARMEQHPALVALRSKVRASEANERTLGAKRLPWPEIQLRLRQNVEVPLSHDVGVALTVPLAVTPAPQLEVARATTIRNQAQLDAERAQMLSELEILTARAESMRDRWRAFEGDYNQTLTAHRQLRARVLNDGTLDPTALLTADRQAIDLEHKRLEVQLDLARAVIELEAVAGPPAPEQDTAHP